MFKQRLFFFHATFHKADWIFTTLVCFVLPFYIRIYSVVWKFLKWKVRGFAFSRILMRLHCWWCIVYTMLVAVAYIMLSCLLLVYFEQVRIFVSVYLLSCIKLFIFLRNNYFWKRFYKFEMNCICNCYTSINRLNMITLKIFRWVVIKIEDGKLNTILWNKQHLLLSEIHVDF